MQLTLEQKDLTLAATVVASLLKRTATTLPVLSNLMIDAEEDRVRFVGTDLESRAVVSIPGRTTGGPGRITVPADKLAELVGLLPAGSSVTVKDEGGQVEIAAEGAKYRLVTLPADDYPEWKTDTARTRFQIQQKTLRRLIDAVHFAVPTKDHRRVLMGILFETVDDKLRLTATDGKKLSRISAPLGEIEGDGGSIRAVASGRLMNDIRRVLGDEGSVAVEIGERQIAFHIDNIEYRTNIIEGKYPDCDAVIPREFPYTVRFNRDQFQLSARRAGVTSEDKNKSIILKFYENTCEFTSMAADVGTFTGKASVDYDGTTLEIAYNFQLLIETLNSFANPDIHLNIKSEQSPSLFLCDAEPDHECVLMPIKLADVRKPPTLDEAGAEV